MHGAEPAADAGFGVQVQWDIPLLDGYRWVLLPNRSPRPRVGGFFGLINPGVYRLVRSGHFDAVITQTGYNSVTYWMLLASAKLSGTPLIFCTDASSMRPFDTKAWKSFIKPLVAPIFFRLNEIIAAGSTAGCEMFRNIGIPAERLVLTPFVVDNDWWIRESAKVDRRSVRAQWRIPEQSTVALFCAKLQPWKRPLDLLEAFAKADVPDAFLVFAGDGPLRTKIESAAANLGVADRVRMLGFVNQSRLPEVYSAADLFVLPSEYEPFAVVVNESMLCGCAALVSDRVGAARDLVTPGLTGSIFPFGNMDAFVNELRTLLKAPERVKQMGGAARKRMETWSTKQTIDGFLEALQRFARQREISAGLR